MKASPLLTIVFLCMIIHWTCAPKAYSPIVVRPASCSDDVQFAESPHLGYLLEFAHKMNKPVFIDFYTPWIESCSRMDKQVYTQDAVARYFNQHFINYKVNADNRSGGSQLADMYGVTIYPTLMFLDGKGKIMLKHEGPATATQLLEMATYLHEAIETAEISLGAK